MKKLFKDMERVHLLLLFFITVNILVLVILFFNFKLAGCIWIGSYILFALMGLSLGTRDTKWNRWWHENMKLFKTK